MKQSHYLQPEWPAPPYVKAYTTLRFEGQSLPPFAAYNFGAYVGDNPEHLAANQCQLMQELNLPSTPLWLKQVHGASALCLDEMNEKNDLEADAAYTHQAERICAVTTADCLPLLICARERFVVAAIHAGWRGLLAGIIPSAIQALRTDVSDLLIWLGPAISQRHYEVGAEVQNAFCAQDEKYGQAFLPRPDQKFSCNLYALARQQLHALGIKEDQVYGGDFCTYTQTALFYSVRRAQPTGRMLSLIYLKKP